MSLRDARPLSGKWEGWTQFGGGSSYYVKKDDGSITLYYDIAGRAIGKARSSACSSKPWSARFGRDSLTTAANRVRIFGSKEAARIAAEAALALS